MLSTLNIMSPCAPEKKTYIWTALHLENHFKYKYHTFEQHFDHHSFTKFTASKDSSSITITRRWMPDLTGLTHRTLEVEPNVKIIIIIIIAFGPYWSIGCLQELYRHPHPGPVSQVIPRSYKTSLVQPPDRSAKHFLCSLGSSFPKGSGSGLEGQDTCKVSI